MKTKDPLAVTGVQPLRETANMTIELCFNDGTSEFREICRTELTAPTVIENRGKFFIKVPCDSRIYSCVHSFLIYRECRGEVLNNIEVARFHDEEVA